MPEELTAAQLAQVKEVVQMTLRAGEFTLPDGSSPQELIEDHTILLTGQTSLRVSHERLGRDMGKVLDVVVGPVKTDWRGDPDPDEERDETQGLMAKTDVAVAAARRLDYHLENGGVPVALPTGIKAAIWTAAGTVVGSGIIAWAMVLAQQT